MATPTAREVDSLLATAPPFKIRWRTRSDGSLVFAHSALQHVYLPIFASMFFAGLAIVGVLAASGAPNATRLPAIMLTVGATVFCSGAVPWARFGARRGRRLVVDRRTGSARFARVGLAGPIGTETESPLNEATLQLHPLTVTTRDPRAGLAGSFTGQLLLLRCGPAAFALAALRKPAEMERYLSSLPEPLREIPCQVEGAISAHGDITVL